MLMSNILRFILPFGLATVFVCAGEELFADQVNHILRYRMPSEVKRFAQQLQFNSITLESNSESLYQTGELKTEARVTGLTKKRGNFYMTKNEHQPGAEALNQANHVVQLCYAINSKYCFELTKNKSGKSWLISKVIFVTPDFDDAKQGFILQNGFRSMVDDAISSLTSVKMVDAYIPVDKLFELPGFQLDSASQDGPNQNVLRANFSYQVTDSETKQPCRSDCVLEFDLGMHCLPTNLHQTYKIGTKEVVHDWRSEWAKIDDENYTTKESVDTKTISNTATKRLIKIRSDMKINTRDLPESDFTLSAFGLPEPPGVEWKKPFPWYLVLAGVGTVCLGIFFFLRSRSRRTQRA